MPYSNEQLQSLQLTAQYAGMSKSATSETLRELVHAAEQARVTVPQVVPKNLAGGQGIMEMEGGQIMRINT